MQLNAYLSFKGECETAFKFYERCLGGKIEMMMTWADSPIGRSGDAGHNATRLSTPVCVSARRC